MKKHRIFIKVALTWAVILLFNGCLEYDIITRVFSDGSIERIFKVTTAEDSSTIFEHSAFKLPTDSTWEIKTWREVEDSTKEKPDSLYCYSARKKFKNYSELNKDLMIDSDIFNLIRIETKLKKKFRWFFTYFEYKEAYNKYFPFNRKPSEDYLTHEEVKYVLSEDDGKNYRYNPQLDKFIPIDEADTNIKLSEREKARAKELENDIETRFEKWQKDNIYEAYYTSLLKSINQTNSKVFEYLQKNKQEFFDSLNSNINLDFVDNEDDLEENKYLFISKTAEFLDLDSIEIDKINNEELQNFFNKLSFLNFSIWYTYKNEIIMPGLLIHTNSKKIEKGSSKWEFRIEDFYSTNFEMYAESRIVNKWAIVLSGLLVTLLLVGLVVGSIKRK